MRIKGEIITRLKEYVERFFFPPKCSYCDEVLRINAKRPYRCGHCSGIVKKQELIICEKCEKPQDIKNKAPYCPYCCEENYRFEFLVAPFIYKTLVREAVHHLKFNKRPTVAETFAHHIFERLLQTDLNDKIKLIVPAPISEKRLAERGYNQTELICRRLSMMSGIPYRNALSKTRDTLPQSSLSEKERRENIKGAISPALPIPEDDVLLVDDVYTTGSTCDECCRILKQMGVRKIYVAVAAINDPGDEDEEENNKLL